MQGAGRYVSVSPRSSTSKRINVRLLGYVHLLLRHARLPQCLVAAGKFATAGGSAPEHALNRTWHLPRYLFDRSVRPIRRGPTDSAGTQNSARSGSRPAHSENTGRLWLVRRTGLPRSCGLCRDGARPYLDEWSMILVDRNDVVS